MTIDLAAGRPRPTAASTEAGYTGKVFKYSRKTSPRETGKTLPADRVAAGENISDVYYKSKSPRGPVPKPLKPCIIY
jgi:hypothetical protein